MSILSSNSLHGAHRQVMEWINQHISSWASKIRLEDIVINKDGYYDILSSRSVSELNFNNDEDINIPSCLSQNFLYNIRNITVGNTQGFRDPKHNLFDPSHLKELKKFPYLHSLRICYEDYDTPLQSYIKDLCKAIDDFYHHHDSSILIIQLSPDYEFAQEKRADIILDEYNDSIDRHLDSIEGLGGNYGPRGSKLTIHCGYLNRFKTNLSSLHYDYLSFIGDPQSIRDTSEEKKSDHDRKIIKLYDLKLKHIDIPDGLDLDIINCQIDNMGEYVDQKGVYVDELTMVKSNLKTTQYHGEPLDMFFNPIHVGDIIISGARKAGSRRCVYIVLEIENQKIKCFSLDQYETSLPHVFYDEEGSQYLSYADSLSKKLGYLPYFMIDGCDCLKLTEEAILSSDENGYLKEYIDKIRRIIHRNS